MGQSFLEMTDRSSFSVEERAFLYSYQAAEAEELHKESHANIGSKAYRYRIKRAWQIKDMDILRYLTSPAALDIDEKQRLNIADVEVLKTLDDSDINENLKAARAVQRLFSADRR